MSLVLLICFLSTLWFTQFESHTKQACYLLVKTCGVGTNWYGIKRRHMHALASPLMVDLSQMARPVNRGGNTIDAQCEQFVVFGLVKYVSQQACLCFLVLVLTLTFMVWIPNSGLGNQLQFRSGFSRGKSFSGGDVSSEGKANSAHLFAACQISV